MSELDFPPFIPAKPKGGAERVIENIERAKGGVADEIAQGQNVKGAVKNWEQSAPDKDGNRETIRAKRKRRTAAEMAAANGSKKKPQPRAAMVPVDSLVAFAGLTTEEIEQVVNVCEAINTFPKQARKRIAAAIGQLFS